MFAQRLTARQLWCRANVHDIAKYNAFCLRTNSTVASDRNETASTPLQERENVRTILRLAQQVRKDSHSTTEDGTRDGQARIASRWWSRSWADVVQEQSTKQHIPTQPGKQISDALQKKLRTPKRMMDSHVSISLPFRSQPSFFEQYINTGGGVRLGKVLEDLDSLAGDASYRHVLGARPSPSDPDGSPIFIVTASVDRLDLIEPLRADKDYNLNGMVIYVGSSSMEVLVTVEELRDNTQDSSPGRAVLTGRFTMATRNAATGEAQTIPPLQLDNDAERQLFTQGQKHKQRKQYEARVSLEKVPPTSQEAQLVHGLWLGSQAKADETCVKIEDTVLSTMSKMHPQQRNVHMKVFGGYLMRSAFELAFINASIFTHGKPVSFLSLDALSFHLPVSIGSVLSLTSRITYTSTSEETTQIDKSHDIHPDQPGFADGHGAVASVVVLAEVVDLRSGRRHKSNTFHFSFDLGEEEQRVLPDSYKDSLAFIEGKRRVDLGNELRQISRIEEGKKA